MKINIKLYINKKYIIKLLSIFMTVMSSVIIMSKLCSDFFADNNINNAPVRIRCGQRAPASILRYSSILSEKSRKHSSRIR